MYPPLPTKQTGFFHFHGSLYQCIIFRNNLRCAHRCIAFILCRYHKIREFQLVSFLGVIPGKDGYYDLIRNVHAYPIKGVVMYQFNENLFFANVKILQEDLEDAV